MSSITGIPQKEDKVLISRIEDLAYSAIENRCAYFTDFLDLRQLSVARGVLKHFDLNTLTVYGGFEDAERNVILISQYDVDLHDFPISCIKISYKSDKKLSHRDFLGALLSLKIKREKIGDIAVHDDCAYVAVSQKLSKAITNELKSVGNCSVVCEICDDFSHNVVSDMQTICGSVSSLRLDCIIALALKLSRENAQNLILRNGVKLNCREIYSPDYKTTQDDVFSVKGYGKYKLSEITGHSKKGKLKIIINKYI